MEGIIKQKQAVAAYKTLEKISEQPMSWKTTYWLTKLKKILKGQVDFQQDCEKKLVEKYHPTQGENGTLKLGSAEEARAFDQEWFEIGNIELNDLVLPHVVIPANEHLEITIRDMEALDGIVEFEAEEENDDIQLLDISPAPENKEEEHED